MAKYSIGLATREDDVSLRKCLRENPFEGTISIAFEAEPSYFDALNVQGKSSQVVVVKTSPDNHLMGFGVRAIRSLYVNGEVKNIGYLSSLRGYAPFRKSIYLAKGFRYFKELDQDGAVPFYLTTIMDDNITAQKALEGGRAGLPFYHPVGDLMTFLIKPRREKKKSDVSIIRGIQVPLEELFSFMQREGSDKQFYPYYEASDLNTGLLQGLHQDDFYVAMEGKEVMGVVARWDQGAFKQSRVVSYAPRMKMMRPLVNIVSKCSRMPYLPPEGHLLRSFFAAFPTIKGNRPEILHDLLCAISSDNQDRGYSYFAIGLSSTDPLVSAVRPFSPREIRSRIYVASYDEHANILKPLEGRVPYLEIATL